MIYFVVKIPFKLVIIPISSVDGGGEVWGGGGSVFFLLGFWLENCLFRGIKLVQ